MDKLGVKASKLEAEKFSSGKSTIARSGISQRGISASTASRLQSIFRQRGWSRVRPGSTLSGTVSKQDDPIGTAKVTCSSLNVRSGAGSNYERIGGLTQGKQVQVYEEKDGWLKIKYGTGFGWISKQFTDFKGPDKPFESYQVRVTADVGLRVRDKAGNGGTPADGSEILGLLSYGTVGTVLDEKNGWFKIDYDGKEGWICGDFVEKYEPPVLVEGSGGIIPEGCSGVGINVPIDPQDTGYNCGAASGAMSLAGRGLNITEKQVASAAGTNTSGSIVYKVRDALNSFAGAGTYRWTQMENYSANDFFNAMKTSIAAKCLPVARIKTTRFKNIFGYGSDGHYVCIAGAYETSGGVKRLIVNDPYSGKWSSSNPTGQKLDMNASDLHQCGKDKGEAYFIHNA